MNCITVCKQCKFSIYTDPYSPKSQCLSFILQFTSPNRLGIIMCLLLTQENVLIRLPRRKIIRRLKKSQRLWFSSLYLNFKSQNPYLYSFYSHCIFLVYNVIPIFHNKVTINLLCINCSYKTHHVKVSLLCIIKQSPALSVCNST